MLIKNATHALRIALEDREVVTFIKAHFSYPEQKPEIRSQKWGSLTEEGWVWTVILIEKPQGLFQKKLEMLNVALVEINAKKGNIIKRQFIKNIFWSELKQLIEKRTKSLCILPEGCKVRSL